MRRLNNIPVNKKIEKKAPKSPQKVEWFNKDERRRYLASLSLEELGGVVKYLEEELTKVEQRNAYLFSTMKYPLPPDLLAATNPKRAKEKNTISSDSVVTGLKDLSINEASSQATEPNAEQFEAESEFEE